jgi:hypothetical protein
MNTKLALAIIDRNSKHTTKTAMPLAALTPGQALLSRLAMSNITARKAGISAGSIGTAEVANAILRAQAAKDKATHMAINQVEKNIAGGVNPIRNALDTKIQDLILDKSLRTLGNESLLLNPLESAKYLLGIN